MPVQICLVSKLTAPRGGSISGMMAIAGLRMWSSLIPSYDLTMF